MSQKIKKRQFFTALGITLCALVLFEVGRSVIAKRALHVNQQELNPEQTRSAEEHFFISSFKDLAEEAALAKTEGKVGVFVFFEMQGCPYCEYMEKKILSQVDVQMYYSQYFRNISMDIHAQTEAIDINGDELTEAEFAKRYAVDLTPTMIFFAADGTELYRQVGFQKTKKQFLDMAKEVVEITQVDM